MDVRVGIDVGQRRDFTAIAVVKRYLTVIDGRDVEHFEALHLDRIPLRTRYTEVVNHIKAKIDGIYARQEERYRRIRNLEDDPIHVQTYLDATGVGRPTGDALKAAGIELTLVTFTGGDKRRETVDGEIHLSKSSMIERLIVIIQNHQLRVAETPGTDSLLNELRTFQRKVTESGRVTYNAIKDGTHDDLITAVGLAVQEPAARLEPLNPELQQDFEDFTGLG